MIPGGHEFFISNRCLQVVFNLFYLNPVFDREKFPLHGYFFPLDNWQVGFNDDGVSGGINFTGGSPAVGSCLVNDAIDWYGGDITFLVKL